MQRPYHYLLTFILMLTGLFAYSQQQDVVFHLSQQLLQGKTIIKIKHDFHDNYLWVLAKNDEVYRVNTTTYAVDNYTPQFAAYNNLQFIDIAGRSKDSVFIATESDGMIQYEAGSPTLVHFANDILTSVGVDYSQRIGADPFGYIA